MRRVHPLWRGFFLAGTLAVTLLLVGGVDGMGAYLLHRRMLALALSVTAGAFLASLPGRWRKNRVPREKPTWRRCAFSFGGGAAMAGGSFMAGGRVLTAFLQGSAGAMAFVLLAWISGFAAVRIAGRRQTE